MEPNFAHRPTKAKTTAVPPLDMQAVGSTILNFEFSKFNKKQLPDLNDTAKPPKVPLRHLSN